MHIHTLQLTDPLGWYCTALHTSPEGQACENRDLVGCVEPVHIRCWVCFCITQFFRIAEHHVIGNSFLSHSSEDVIRCAVDDAAHPVDSVAAKGLLQGFNDRNATTDRCFDQDVNTCFCSCFGDFLTMARDHGLVGCHDRLPSVNGLENERAGRFQTPDHFNHHVHLRVVDNLRWVAGEDVVGQLNRS